MRASRRSGPAVARVGEGETAHRVSVSLGPVGKDGSLRAPHATAERHAHPSRASEAEGSTLVADGRRTSDVSAPGNNGSSS
jgi:hypothetical protein